MKIINDARKLARSFLTLDDLVLGQSLTRGGMGQLGRVAMSSSGPSVALNVASRFLCLGAQITSRVAGIPLSGGAKTLAGKIGDQAKALGDRCSTLAVQGIELAGGKKAQNPITKLEWLNKSASPGYTPGDLAADTTVGTLRSLASMSFSLGIDAVRMAPTDMVSKAADAASRSLPGAGGTDQSDGKALREGLVAVTIASGVAVVRAMVALPEAAARLALSDSRALLQAMRNGVRQARLLNDLGQHEAVSGAPINAVLRATAKIVAQHPPEAFMAALERGIDGRPPSPTAILTAMVKDTRALVTFFTMYPVVLGLLGSELSALLAGGLARPGDAEAYAKDDSGGKSATFTLLDALVGGAVSAGDQTPLFSRATVYLAQDISFNAYRELRGRDAALDRAERLFGNEARLRLAGDISLDSETMAAESQSALEKRVRTYISTVSDANALSRQIDLCAERLALLQSAGARDTLMTVGLSERRIEILRAFTSLAAVNLAMRDAKSNADTRAPDAFYAWASAQ